VSVTELVVIAVGSVRPVGVVPTSEAQQDHPLLAVGRPTTPLEAVPPVPTFTEKEAVLLACEMLGLVPKPLEIVGAVPETSRFGHLIEPEDVDVTLMAALPPPRVTVPVEVPTFMDVAKLLLLFRRTTPPNNAPPALALKAPWVSIPPAAHRDHVLPAETLVPVRGAGRYSSASWFTVTRGLVAAVVYTGSAAAAAANTLVRGFQVLRELGPGTGSNTGAALRESR
jgi:hypothetical protein